MFTWIRKENRSNLETEKSVCDIWKCPRARRGSTIGINIGLSSHIGVIYCFTLKPARDDIYRRRMFYYRSCGVEIESLFVRRHIGLC